MVAGGDCGLQTVLDASLPAGDYTLVIEGFADSSGVYDIMMNCLPPDTSFMDGDIGCGQTVTGTTVGSLSNAGNGGGDHLYHFTLPRGQDIITFDSCDSQFDTYLIVHEAVASGNAAEPFTLGAEITGCDDW